MTKLKRGYEHPCFELDWDNYAQVDECLERTEDEPDCIHLFRGGTWETCPSGKLHPSFDHYREWTQTEFVEFVSIPLPKGWSEGRWVGEIKKVMQDWFNGKGGDLYPEETVNNALAALAWEEDE